MVLRYYIPAFLFFLCLSAYPQSISKSLRKARMAVDKGDFAKGAAEYQKVLTKDSTHFYGNLEYGLLLFEYMNEPSGAGKYLIRAERKTKKDTMPELLLGLGKYYQHITEHNKALAYFQRFYKLIDLNDDDGKLLEQEVRRYMDNCRYAIDNPKGNDLKRIKVVNMGAGINTLYPEYVPLLSRDGNTLIFTSRRRVNDKSKIDEENGGFYEDMYLSKRDKDGTFKSSQPFSLQGAKIPGSTDRHESVISLSFVDDKLITFFDGKIYETVRQGETWSNPALINDNLNKESEFRNHICISHDGQTLYYSAERHDGLGGLDLYRSTRDAAGKWGPGVNMGPGINTSKDEGDPELSEDGTTLYFASKGHPGYGGYDFFKTTLINGEWTTPKNLGKPFNSPGDDIYISINKDETAGHLSSSRIGGFGDMDIYEIKQETPFSDFVSDNTVRLNITLPDTVFVGDTVLLKPDLSKAGDVAFSNYYWQVNDSVLKKEGRSVAYLFQKPGTVKIRVQGELAQENFDLVGAERTIIVSERKIPVVTTNTVTSGQLENLPPLEIVYFDLNRSDISESATLVLDRNLEILKKTGSTIEIAAYCDTRGSAAYNKALSQRRAQSVVNYLKKKGFNARLIKKAGSYGESEPVNRCADGIDCSEDEHRLNRRVEIRWIPTKK